MLTRRQFLEGAAIGAGGIVTGSLAVTFGRRLLAVSSGSDSAPPVVPPFDEEFNSPLGAEWHELASSTGSWDVDDTVAGALYMSGEAPAASVGIYRSIPDIPFTVTAKITEVVNDASDFSDCGVMLGEATPGSFIHGCWDVAFLGDFTIIGSRWSSPTVWVTNIGSHQDPGNVAIPHYSRFVVNSQDDVDGFFSADGESWVQWLNAYNPPFTIGSVGLDLHNLDSPTSMTVDWLRFT